MTIQCCFFTDDPYGWGGTANPPTTGQLAVSVNIVSNSQTYAESTVDYPTSLQSQCVVTVTIPRSYYFITYYKGTGSYLVGGNAQYTRIA